MNAVATPGPDDDDQGPAGSPPAVAAGATTTVNEPDAAAVRDAFPHSDSSIKQYVDILTSRGVDWGLIGPREVDRIWERHILNSVAIADLIPQGSTVVDVGSGAGLPGVPLALARPDLRVTLLEPLLRRATFLTDVVDTLALADRVEVVRSRAEDHTVRYDVVVARALAPLPRLVPWCAPLMEPAGIVLALKGRTADREVADAAAALRAAGVRAEVLEVRAHATAEPTSVVRLRR